MKTSFFLLLGPPPAPSSLRMHTGRASGQIDSALIEEIQHLRARIQPDEVLLVADGAQQNQGVHRRPDHPAQPQPPALAR